jgi:hypothetical protein
MARRRKEALKAGAIPKEIASKFYPPVAIPKVQQAGIAVNVKLSREEGKVVQATTTETPGVAVLQDGRLVLTPEASRDHEMRSIILGLKSKAANKDQIAKVMRDQYGLSREQCIAYERDALHELALRCKEESPFARAEQVFRIRAALTELHNPPPIRRMVKNPLSGKLEARLIPAKKNWQAIARFEALLMEVEGNHDPQTIQVNLTQNTLQVFQGLTDQRRAELLARAKQRQHYAELAQRHLPEQLSAPKTA